MASKAEKINVALVGASGLVGKEILSILNERALPIETLKVAAQASEVGQQVSFGDQMLHLEAVSPEFFRGSHAAILATSEGVASEYLPLAAQHCELVIDMSRHSRLKTEHPLVVVGVNEDRLTRGIVANANCVATHLSMVLHPLHRAFGLKKVLTSTYQAVAGAGLRGLEEFSTQIKDLFNYREPQVNVFPHRMAFNLIPHIGEFDDNGVSEEENDIMHEVRKILGLPALEIMATAVRVPVFHGHAQSVFIELTRAASVNEVRQALDAVPGVVLIDDPKNDVYPIPSEAQGQDEVFVGRIRKDLYHSGGYHMWIVADNLRKGSALNAVQLIEKYFLADAF